MLKKYNQTMLSKKNRLPRQAFNQVFQKGTRLQHPLFQLILLANNLPNSRFACVVSTKIDKHAVVRNRMKRLIHESIHHLVPDINSHIDAVIIVKRNFSKEKQPVIEAELTKLLQPYAAGKSNTEIHI